MIKPIYLLDLDDNIFHSARKLQQLNQCAQKPAAVDKNQVNQSFMTKQQVNYLDWLLAFSLVIPVTGRGTQETSRVLINFNSWKILAHGAVIQKPDGHVDDRWQKHISGELKNYQTQLKVRQQWLIAAFAKNNINALARINYEYNELAISLVIKHRDRSLIDEIYFIADMANKELGIEGFYLHKNNNNITWLPKCVEKGLAVNYLLEQLQTKEKAIPVIGFGDSMSDFSFLQLCDWFGMPKQSQLTDILKNQIP